MFSSCRPSLLPNLSKILIRCPKGLLVSRVCNFSLSFCRKSHYDTLRLSKSCTKQEIRDAFITLSKQYHPDKNKNNPKAQEQFVKINEAYNVLMKSESRREYDINLRNFGDPSNMYRSPNKNDFYQVHRYDSQYRDPWKDPSFARNQKGWNDKTNNDSYYGVKGMKRMSNDRLVFWIITLAGIGLFLQITMIRFAGIRSYSTYDRISQENRQYLQTVRERADLYGSREKQLEEYKLRSGVKEEE